MDPNNIQLKPLGSEKTKEEDAETQKNLFYPERTRVLESNIEQIETEPKRENIFVRFFKILIISVGLFVALIVGFALYVSSQPPYVEASETFELGANARISLNDFGTISHWQGKKNKISIYAWWDMVGKFNGDEFIFYTKENAKKFSLPKVLIFPNIVSNRKVKVQYTKEEIAKLKAIMKVYKR